MTEARELIICMVASLVLTLFFELTLAWMAKLRSLEHLRIVALVNCITNPILVTIVWAVRYCNDDGWTWRVVLGLLEIAVVFVEGAMFKRWIKEPEMKHPLLFAFYFNAVSFGLGELLNLGLLWFASLR